MVRKSGVRSGLLRTNRTAIFHGAFSVLDAFSTTVCWGGHTSRHPHVLPDRGASMRDRGHDAPTRLTVDSRLLRFRGRPTDSPGRNSQLSPGRAPRGRLSDPGPPMPTEGASRKIARCAPGEPKAPPAQAAPGSGSGHSPSFCICRSLARGATSLGEETRSSPVLEAPANAGEDR